MTVAWAGSSARAPRRATGETFNWLHADSILDSEPPKHTRLRRLVAGAFGRGHVARLAPRIEQLAPGLLDAAAPAGSAEPFDVLAGYAEPLPVLVIAELLGVPEADRVHLRPWSQAIVKMYEVDRTDEQEAQARTASAEFSDYVEALAADRARHPGEDLLTDLVQARDGGDRLSARELVATAVLLLNAGHEASVNGFGNGLHSMLTAQPLPAVDIEDPAAVERLAEEFLRHDSPLHLFERTAKERPTSRACTSSPVTRWPHSSGRPTATRPSSPTRTVSTPPGSPTRTWRSAPGSTSASVHRWPGSSCRSRCAPCWRRFPGLQLVEAERRPTFVLRGFERLVVSPRA